MIYSYLHMQKSDQHHLFIQHHSDDFTRNNSTYCCVSSSNSSSSANLMLLRTLCDNKCYEHIYSQKQTQHRPNNKIRERYTEKKTKLKLYVIT